MHIKKLEICGFKSFVDKTVIHFDHDVIGVVGPNGCGKSNIVDAIRWCMGEQSAKHLRGRSMEDVIFNGSESRAQHGMAEVTLTFDNSDRIYAATLPEAYRDFPEVAVTRRLFRDGTSDYLLNKTPVRLRDVTDLFLGTGVGTKAYSIIEQGRVGQIVTSRPQDRRMYIEEAAGVTKYRLRRKQAERKLDMTRQNLLRITDIVNEIDRNRASLKRQAAKAERYVSYRGELEDLFLHDASHRLLEMIVLEKVRVGGRNTVLETSLGLKARLEEGETSLVEARVEASQIEQRFEVISSKRAAAEQHATEQRSESARLRDRIKHLEERFSAFSNEREALSTRQSQVLLELEGLQQKIASLSSDEATRDEETDADNAALAAAQENEQALAGELTALRGLLGKTQSEKAALTSRLEALEHRRKDAEANQARVDEDESRLESEREALEHARQTVHKAQQAADARRAEAEAHVVSLETRLTELGTTLTTERQALAGLESELTLKRSRLKVLTDLHDSLEGVGAGTKALLDMSDPAVVGLLADRLDVPPEYSDALVSVLGDRLHAVIVEDPERGLALLDGLREGKQGRATIALRRPTPVPEANCPAAEEPSVLGRLIEKVSYDAADEPLIRSLIGETLLVGTASEALALNQRHPGTRVVTLDGTVVRGNGLVSGGSGDDVAAALLAQKREIRELEAAMPELVAGRDERTASTESIQSRLSEVRAELDEQRRTAYSATAEASSAEKDDRRIGTDLLAIEQRRARIVTDREQRKQQAEGIEQERRKSQETLLELAQNEEALRVDLERTEGSALQARELANVCADRVTERRIRLAQVREQLEAHRITSARLSTESTNATSRLHTLDAELHDAAVALGTTAAHLLRARETLQVAELEAHDLERGVDDTRALLEQVRDSLSQREGELRELRANVATLEEELRDHEMEIQKLALGRGHLLQGVSEKFRGLDLNRVVGDYHKRPPPDLEHRRRIDELTKLIDRMGPVNLDARDEYDEAERRFVELNDQREDIEKAVTELERAIRHMDRESRRRFKETFDLVNELFKKSFARLFKGGRAELKLTDPENLLDTGVDIIAQPPGKKLGNIELMSGGEKALTAAALIFAIFQHRPSPFCVLDEVDAPLDDANVGRYNEAIRSMTDRSQFIVITHIKQTMQAVDVLYGVTMGEPGVSRVVSVKVNDAVATRSAKRTLESDAPPRSQSNEERLEQVVA